MQTKIKYEILTGQKRMNALSDLSNGQIMAGINYENVIYSAMTTAYSEYYGGYWEFYKFENGGFAMILDAGETDKVQAHWGPNYFEGELSKEALSLGVNLIASSVLAFRTKGNVQKGFVENHDFLMEVAKNHEEASQILRFID
ncbi:hypothetical protein AMBLS11_12395 [Alteromonas macleodii str. 'Black Sea 11']|nr:hypothetical protein AMBLS11_12395 [Alteromonas macleodii str. 'Black Sea 11']